ncbi:MAG: PAS domain-containing sensor histidine kinase [Cellvibrionaceae bacterium]
MRYEDAVLILDLVDSGVIMLNEHQEIVFWNQFISNTSHIAFDAIEGKHWLDVFPSLQESRIEKAVEKAIDLNFPSILSYKLLRSNFPLYKKSLATKPPYLLVQSIIMKPIIEDGKNKGCIIYINDVSAASKREDDLNHQSVELKLAIKKYEHVKERFKAVFYSAHNGIIIFDETGVVEDINSAAMSMLNISDSSLDNTHIEDFIPKIKKIYFSEKDECYQHDGDVDYEFEQTLPGYTEKHLLISLNQIEGDVDNKFFIFITDITERKNAEKALLSANTELEEFAYRTSHDLRSPIVSAVGLMKIAKDSLNKQDFEKVHTCMDHADKSLRKLEVLIRDILQLTEMQNKEEDIQEIDIQTMIDEIWGSFSQLEGFDNIQKSITLEHSKPLFAKKTRVNMILENLVSNAIKYYDSSIEAPSITIKTYVKDNAFILDVSDNGLGIPEGQKHKLFKMFNRFHPKVSFGSGLGLYLMKKSAEFIGGDIRYVDQPKGARFKLTIPQENKLH